MFNLQSFSSQKSLVADGNIASALNRIRSLLTKLLHSPETGVIWLNNAELSSISKGRIVSLANIAPYTCILSSAVNGPGQPELCRGFAISLGNSTASGKGGYFRFGGEALVFLEPGLVLAEGDSIYVSESIAGAGTNVQPSSLNCWVRQVGIVKDASIYSTSSPVNLYAKVLMEPCCEQQLAQ